MWSSIRMTPFVAVVSVVFFGLLSSSNVVNAASQEVVKLTDDTFEHQTQASTGSTTGSWLILFHVPNCSSCDRLKPTLDELGNDEELYENGIVLGSVDCSTNPNVCLRFSTTKLPVLMYLHKKRLYRYQLKKEHDEFDNLLILPDMMKLKSFVMKGYDGEEGETIPDPPSALDVLMKQITKAYEGSPLAGYAIFGMAGMIMLTILMLVVTLVFPSSSGGGDEGAKTKKKTKKSSSKKKE